MITLIQSLATDDADVLQTAGSQLRRAPDDGVYRVWVGSDQVDGQLGVNVAGLQVLEDSEIPIETVSTLDTSKAPYVEFPVEDGDDVIMNYNEVTAGTAIVKVQFLDEVDLALEGIE